MTFNLKSSALSSKKDLFKSWKTSSENANQSIQINSITELNNEQAITILKERPEMTQVSGYYKCAPDYRLQNMGK